MYYIEMNRMQRCTIKSIRSQWFNGDCTGYWVQSTLFIEIKKKYQMRSQIWETERLQSQFLSFLILTLDWNPLVTTSSHQNETNDRWPLSELQSIEQNQLDPGKTDCIISFVILLSCTLDIPEMPLNRRWRS